MPTDASRELGELIAAEISADGPMRFSRYVELALYQPGLGFYERAGEAGGRRGDFITSVETGPLFAAILGEWLDGKWIELGRPDPFLVAEAGAGVGTLWRGIDRARPSCFDALHWTLVERSSRLREAHADLPGDRWSSRGDLPDAHQHATVANELLDNLAFDIIERTTEGWSDVRVELGEDGFVFGPGAPISDGPDVPSILPGARVPHATGANKWLELAGAGSDSVVVFDYGAATAEIAERTMPGWLRTYARHERGTDPLACPGDRDITHDVPFDQLCAPRSWRAQAEWLIAHGIDQRIDAAKATWNERAGVGDLAAMYARSAINEAQALSDPAGLGGFQVLEW